MLVRGEASEGSTLCHKKDAATRVSRLQNLKTKKQKRPRKKIYLASPLVTLPQIQTAETLLPQTAVLDEPDTLDLDTIDVPIITSDNDSEGSCVEIVDGESDTDVCEETASARFSRILCDAQKKAQVENAAKGSKRRRLTVGTHGQTHIVGSAIGVILLPRDTCRFMSS